MAKETAKPVKKTATKRATPAAKVSVSASDKIEKACVESLKKLQELGIEQQLQSEIEWCLGSYRNDLNPSGLYEVAARTLTIFQAEKSKKTKGVTAKMITDLEGALNTSA
ncbi:hypothetical protein KK062_09950 [Fulvivirgaceae bacterium PWU5]|uniref:Uncharacterized protein n=1 Tax=Dawidia cretensis TaxID=2782350 RepID=A0AAP2DY50_9BACT|nr:hypothetical protein [Dawidia cretensis]MBT1708549.1 hypothetical protein [Dawidia cretensis]